MGFTPNNQYMAYFNINNLNDSRKPGQNGSWSPEKMPTGVLRTVMEALTITSKQGIRHGIPRSSNATHTHETDGTDEMRTNYIVNRNTYAYSFARSINRMLSLNTSHDVYWKPNNRATVQAIPTFSYQNWNRNSNNVGATFSEDYNNITSSFIEGIYSGDNNHVLETMLNREISALHMKGHSLNSALALRQRLSLNGDMFTFGLTANTVTAMKTVSVIMTSASAMSKRLLNQELNDTTTIPISIIKRESKLAINALFQR